ncbi:hypothetical protein MMC27_001883 [Xylographa pallens]|nr:hypothetical protein [Xylographa pallens]
MSFIKKIFKHDKSESQRTQPQRFSSSVICLDTTYEYMLFGFYRTDSSIECMPWTERGFRSDGSRKSFVEAAYTARQKINCPTRLQNYLSTPRLRDERAYFEDPAEFNDLRPVCIDKVEDANGVRHTTAWFVCTYDLLDYAFHLPRGESWSASLPIKEVINTLPRHEARVVTNFMIGFTRDRLRVTSDRLKCFYDRPSTSSSRLLRDTSHRHTRKFSAEEDSQAVETLTELLGWLESRS